MKGIKNRGSKIHRIKTNYTRNPKHKVGMCYDRNVCENDTNGDQSNDDDEPEPPMDITREQLKTDYGLTDSEILELDREAQQVMGKTLMMIDTALKDESLDCTERLETALNFIEMCMSLIEHNLESLVDSKVTKEKLN